ncbi:MAG: hypothetical protein ACI802_002436 [Candidatus Paceibacteria bacterium]
MIRFSASPLPVPQASWIFAKELIALFFNPIKAVVGEITPLFLDVVQKLPRVSFKKSQFI